MRLSLLLLCIVVSGCSPIYYAPNTLNVPMIRGKGEIVGSGHFGDHGSLNFQGAYSPKQNFAITGDGFWASEKSSSSISGSGHYITGGAGYYRPITPHLMWDAYGLMGFGSVKNNLSNTGAQRDVSSRFVRYGVQPSFGFQSKFFDASFATRFVGVRYYHTTGSEAAEVQYLKDAPTQFLFEPALTVRAGYDVIKAQFQIGHSHNMTNKNFKQEDDIASIGLVFTLGRK